MREAAGRAAQVKKHSPTSSAELRTLDVQGRGEGHTTLTTLATVPPLHTLTLPKYYTRPTGHWRAAASRALFSVSNQPTNNQTMPCCFLALLLSSSILCLSGETVLEKGGNGRGKRK